MIAVTRKHDADGKHYLKLGMLKSIDLDRCVEYIDDVDSVDTGFFEGVHNTWEWLEDEPSRPWWKVYVVGGRDVVWVSHHVLCDANSGIPFHRTFLHGLNDYYASITAAKEEEEEEKKPAPVDAVVALDPAKFPLLPDPMTLSRHKASLMELVWTQVKRLLVRLVSGSRLMFSNLPEPRPYFSSVTAVAPPSMRTTTRLSAMRIPAERVSRILVACRANGTTFTGLLMVMLLATFSVDLFPDDRVGCSLFAFDIRRQLRMPEGLLDAVLRRDGTMMNGATGGFLTHWLRHYREVVTAGGGVDAEAVWRLARWYKGAMVQGIPNRYMRGWMAGGLLGADLEGFVGRVLGGIGRATGKSFLCSNLGAFSFEGEEEADEEKEEGEKKKWTISDLQFSASCVNGNVGSRGFVFNVVGVKGGDTVVHVSYEEGVVSQEMAEDSLWLTMEKIDALLEAEEEEEAA